MATVDDIRRLVDTLDRRTEKVETILMVREPSSVAAADAYEGLRKQVVSAVSERLIHLAQLAEFDVSLHRGADGEVLGKLVDSWLAQASLVRMDSIGRSEDEALFELVTDDGTGPLTVVEPAYADRITGRLVRTGRAARIAPVDSSPEDGSALTARHRTEELA